MNKRRWIWFVLIILGAAIFAPLGQILIEGLIIHPVSRVWWITKQIFISLGQYNLWLIFTSTAGFFTLLTLIRGMFIFPKFEEKPVVRQGPLESLSTQIARSKKNPYFKWLIANQLSELTLLILKQKTLNNDGKRKSFDGISWNPPPEVKAYLEAGLKNSFLEYRSRSLLARLPFSIPQVKSEETPYDIDLTQVVDYIESQMEKPSDKRN